VLNTLLVPHSLIRRHLSYATCYIRNPQRARTYRGGQ